MSACGPTIEEKLGIGEHASMLTIIIPAYNEVAGIAHAVNEIKNVAEKCADLFEIIVVDDGSTDATFGKISELAQMDQRVKGMKFSRNFGKESAILAGLRASSGNVVVTIDADLQHPPSLIPEMLAKWRQGAKVVHAVKSDSFKNHYVYRLRANIVAGILEKMGGIKIGNSSDFKLLDRMAVDVLVREVSERGRFYRGLTYWVGFDQVSVPFAVVSRTAGTGKWTLLSLISLAITAIVSFTSAPLRIVTVLGALTLLIGFVIGIEALISWFRGQAVSGFATIILTLLILGSFIMISLGIIGEYLARIYDEIKARPSYLVESITGFETYNSIDNSKK